MNLAFSHRRSIAAAKENTPAKLLVRRRSESQFHGVPRGGRKILASCLQISLFEYL